MPKEPTKPHYLLCNADESEPGTFKDRELIRWDPHQLLEGCLIAAYAIRAKHVYVYCRGEFFETTQILAKALEDAYAKGYAGKDIMGSGVDVDVTVHVGAGAYICGEETGLMNSLEGRRGQPRVKPPFPAAVGAFGMPSTVNNVETLSAVPHIVTHGGQWYRQWGTEKSPGTKLFCVSGHVNKPGNYELPLGFPLTDLIEDVCGGMRGGKALKAVIPGGSSVPILNAEECAGCALDYEGVQAAGSQLGCASVIVMDEGTDIVKQVRRMVQFYMHESCGQCTPCREGTAWMTKVLRRIEEGHRNRCDITNEKAGDHVGDRARYDDRLDGHDAVVELGPHFFDHEENSRERGVECSREPSACACCDERVDHGLRQSKHIDECLPDRGSYLNRGPFASHQQTRPER